MIYYLNINFHNSTSSSINFWWSFHKLMSCWFLKQRKFNGEIKTIFIVYDELKKNFKLFI